MILEEESNDGVPLDIIFAFPKLIGCTFKFYNSYPNLI